MARFARAVAIGAAHHITQRGVDQQRVFFTDADRHTYLDCLQTYSAQARLRILAYCLMSNHIHLVAIPDEPQSLRHGFAPHSRPLRPLPQLPSSSDRTSLAESLLFLRTRRNSR